MSLGLWIPESAREERVSTCRCGKKFAVPREQRALTRHVAACVRQHADEIQSEVAEREENFGPHDPEGWKWGRKRHAEGKVGFKNGLPA